MENKLKPFTFDRVVRMCIGCVVAVGLFFLLKKLSPVLLPFIIAWLLAYLIYPVVVFFQQKCRLRNRALSIIAALLSITGIIVLITLILTPFVSKEIAKMSVLVSNYIQNASSGNIIPAEWQPFIIDFFNQLDFEKFFSVETIYNLSQKLLPTFWSIVSSTFSLLLSILTVALVLLYFVFILKDYEKISKKWIDFIPNKYRKIVSEIAFDLKTGMNRYFRGQALVAALVGILFAIGFEIIGLPLGIIMGLFIGVLNLAPYLQVLGFVPVTLLALLKTTETGSSFWWMMAAVAAVFIIVQIIQDGIIVPKIMGKVTGMNPAIILLSLSIWGLLLGVVGLIIALPITTLIVSYYKRFVVREKKKLS